MLHISSFRERMMHRLTKLEVLQFGAEILIPSREDLREEWWRSFLLLPTSKEEKRTAENAGWIATHWKREALAWLISRADEIAEVAMRTESSTMRRLSLTLLFHLMPLVLENQQELTERQLRLLNFCLDVISPMQSAEWSVGLSMKIAAVMVRTIPELREEVRTLLEMIDENLCTSGIRGARHNALKMLAQKRKR